MSKKIFCSRLWLVGGCAILIAGASLAHIAYDINVNEASRLIKLTDFKPGSELTCEAADINGKLSEIKAQVGADGSAQIQLPETASVDNAGQLSYKLKVENPALENVKALELFMKLDPKTNNISLSGSGVGDFADISIKNGDTDFISKSDWSGLFEQNVPMTSEILEVAFQKQNIASDALLGDKAKIEALSLFGESSRDGLPEVQARYGLAIRRVTTALSNVLVRQTVIIGAFLDAKIQLDTQRKLQELKARAHKDYHPSEQMCRFGSFIKSLASAETKSAIDKKYINKVLMNTYMGVTGNNAENGEGSASKARVHAFKEYYCDPQDNNGALDTLCTNHVAMNNLSPQEKERLNKDIDYTRTIDTKLTLKIDYADHATPAVAPTLTDEELDVIALAKNLYIPQVFANQDKDSLERDPRWYFASRSFAAKMNVAHTSFINIVGMKTEAPEGRPTTALASLPNLPRNMQIDPANPDYSMETATANVPNPNVRSGPIANKGLVLTEDAGWSYMKALMREFGLPDENGNGTTDDEINSMLGERPSYYAQMEVLTKKIYQSPHFYTNLYDKPANVKRMGVAMDAIGLMHLRDRFDSHLRQEMLAAMLVEVGLDPISEQTTTELYSGMKQQQSRQ